MKNLFLTATMIFSNALCADQSSNVTIDPSNNDKDPNIVVQQYPASSPSAYFKPTKKLNGLSVEFISEYTSITAGQQFRVGLIIKHHKGYHSYWKNPGVVGVPTTTEWELPEGFTASEAHWPYPQQSKMLQYPCYAYKRDILLMYTITAPKKFTTNGAETGSKATSEIIDLTANTRWMCCFKKCHPGFATFSLKLTAGENSEKSKYASAFKAAEKELPITDPSITAELISEEDAAEIKVHITSKKNITPIHVFNSDKQTSSDLKHSISEQADGSYIYTAERSEYSPKGKKTFPFVLQTEKQYVYIVSQQASE